MADIRSIFLVISYIGASNEGQRTSGMGVKILVLSVGKERQRPIREAVEDYLRRARPTFECDWIEVRQHRASSESEAQRARDEEGERLLQRVPAGFRTIALDERGRMLDSPAFSTHLDNQRVASRSGVAFLIFCAFGHSAQLLQNVDEKLSLSPLTLPHSLALVVLAEQIYRAKTLIRGEPYHKM